MPALLNVIGPQIRDIRERHQLTQEALAARCQVRGLDMTRGTLAKIESQVRTVSDHEIPFIAAALRVGITDLFPKELIPLHRKPRNPKGTSKRAKRRG